MNDREMTLMTNTTRWIATVLTSAALILGVVDQRVCADGPTSGPADATRLFRLGEKLVIKGRTFYVAGKRGGQLVLSPPQPPTATIGAMIAPVAAKASSWQENAARSPQKLIDGSGWGQSWPGSGIYVHSNNVFEGGSNMWNGDPDSWLWFDLGRVANLAGMYVWNYNEKDPWNTRSVREVELSVSSDDKTFLPAGMLMLQKASGTPDDRGEVIKFDKPLRARYVKLQIRSNYRGGEMSGLAEIRFADADQEACPTARLWTPKYPRPEHPKLAIGQPLDGSENIVFPADSGIVDVTGAPYFAKGDGVADDTAAIQRALDDHPNAGAIIYLPNGVYLISDTLRWPHGNGGGAEEKRTVLHGQSRAGSVIKLSDACPGFEDSRHPRACIWTGKAPAQRFGNEIHHLTVDTGVDNPGACGVQFIANNQGGMADVTIVSGDGQGVAGLDLGYTDEQGPCLIKNVRVVGFDIGVHTATGVASVVLEHITVEHQNHFGFRNDGQPCTVRGLKSTNDVPAFVAAGGLSVLIDAALAGTGNAAKQPAVICDAGLMARNVRASGYAMALEDNVGGENVRGPVVDQFLSKPAVSLFGQPGVGLHLPIRETPELPRDELADWVSPLKFGATLGDGQDDSKAIQAAIDSGATTIYLPRGDWHIGHTIEVRGKARRIIGCKAMLNIVGPLRDEVASVFRFADGTDAKSNGPPILEMEGLHTDFSDGPYVFMENTSRRTLVLRRLMINFQGARAYHGKGPGTVFIEDVVGRYFHFEGQTVWARQFNVEGDGTHVTNDGGSLWILGYKTEGGGTLIETKGGGRTEVLGGLSYTVGRVDASPMFVVNDSQLSLTFSEVCFTGKPFTTIVAETRNGQTKTLPHTAPAWRGQMPLFTAGSR